jgi:hypothetical protein
VGVLLEPKGRRNRVGEIEVASKSSPDFVPEDILEYPQHPFPSYLSAMLAKLPPGLSDLALQRLLSFAVMQLLKGVADWKDEIDELRYKSDFPCVFGSFDTRLVERCKQLLVHSKLNDIEKIVCSATMAYAMTIGKQQRNEALFGWYKTQLAIEPEQLVQCDLHWPDEIACLQWAAIIIAMPIAEPPLEISNARMKLVDAVLCKYGRARDWELVRRDGLRLFWDEDSELKWFICWEVVMWRRVDGIVK